MYQAVLLHYSIPYSLDFLNLILLHFLLFFNRFFQLFQEWDMNVLNDTFLSMKIVEDMNLKR